MGGRRADPRRSRHEPGTASGIVAGLVAITPGAGFVAGMAPLAIGLIAGFVCSYAVRLKFKAGDDDSLDVVGGLVGSVLIGFFARPGFFGGGFEAGLLHGGDAGLLVEQVIANVVTMAFAFVVTFAITKALALTVGVRVSEDVEVSGLESPSMARPPTTAATWRSNADDHRRSTPRTIERGQGDTTMKLITVVIKAAQARRGEVRTWRRATRSATARSGSPT